LVDEVYWHAPNLSKQRIIGQRDTLLLPTDIQYHRDHLGIVQNNFPDFIRIGDGGDEVRDVPHPLSALGLTQYDFRLSRDSVRIHLPDRTITLLEVMVRPKNDREARVIGAIYIDPTAGQVVRMAFNFTRGAFIDQDLEDLALVLENRLVGGKYWLPSRQELEIRRTGTWLDYPVRGIIRGRWEIGDYQFNLGTPAPTFAGDEIVLAPAAERAKYRWPGTIMDSLPADVRATVDPDIKRVLDEARVLVRAQALQRVQSMRLSAPHASDFVHVDRVEGLAVGAGFRARVVSEVSLIGRARYGTDDRAAKGLGELRWEQASGSSFGLFGSRDFADIGDVPERSAIVNSLGAQEFGSDLSDPYRVDAVGVRFATQWRGIDLGITATREWQSPLTVHATPATGLYEATPDVVPLAGNRLALSAHRPYADWFAPGQIQLDARVSVLAPATPSFAVGTLPSPPVVRLSTMLEHRSTFARSTLVIREQAAGVLRARVAAQELVYFGGPISAPGFALHSIAGTTGSSTRVELQTPIPFIPVPLGRFGRVPGQARVAPYANLAGVRGDVDCPAIAGTRCPELTHGWYPSVGVGLLTVFDILRFDVARGLSYTSASLLQSGPTQSRSNRGWMFNVDVTRDFWSIL
jgi:hypothetical protein